MVFGTDSGLAEGAGSVHRGLGCGENFTVDNFHPIPRSLTLVQTYSKRVAVESRSGSLVSANVEPFLPVAYSHDRGAAYPHSPSMPFNTFNGLFIWEDARDDELMFRLAVEYHTEIWEKAIELGVSRRDAFFPPNYVRLHPSCADVVLLTSVLCLPVPVDHSGHSNLRTQLASLASNQKEGGSVRPLQPYWRLQDLELRTPCGLRLKTVSSTA